MGPLHDVNEEELKRYFKSHQHTYWPSKAQQTEVIQRGYIQWLSK